jgi:NAD(P)H-flavin reductase
MAEGRVLAPFGRRAARVTGRDAHGPYVVLRCLDGAGPAPAAGQFYMLAAAERWGGGEDERPFLPRPFSAMRARQGAAGVELEFVLEDVGPGTRRLAEVAGGEDLLIVGPLGQGFTAPRDGRRALLVGGGVGIAPLVIWSEALGGAGSVLLGFRDAAHAEGAALLPGARLATDDGSAGHLGLVTELLEDELDEDEHAEAYACGPPPMLEAVRRICAERDVPAQLALESGMACGYGACFGCVVATRDGLVRLCVDGPVLSAATLEAVA